VSPATVAPRPDASWAWFFDLDGTLVAIQPSPGSVRIDPSLRRMITERHRATGGAVALITGRSIADIDRLFPGVRLAVAGQHGAERRRASGAYAHRPAPPAPLVAAGNRLQATLAAHRGVRVEVKGVSLALHYRAAPRLAGYVHRLARQVAAQLGERYCLQAGKRVVEIRPSGRDKGSAIRDFMQEPPFRGRIPVFLGDDTTDEFGFAMVNRLHGCSVKIGPGATQAHWRLPDVRAARSWLEHGSPAPRRVS
jgi:trehalose 6-phosphate phosphatase